MAGKLDICNIAISRIGQTQITSLSEDDKKARLCNVFFDHVRDALLQDQWWSFATKRQTLALLTETPDSGFDYYYQIPTDCIEPRYLVDETILYEIEGDKVATDSTDDIELVYTFRETDTTKFSSQFRDLLSYKLALELVLPITKDMDMRDRIERDYVAISARYSQIDKRRGQRAIKKNIGWRSKSEDWPVIEWWKIV